MLVLDLPPIRKSDNYESLMRRPVCAWTFISSRRRRRKTGLNLIVETRRRVIYYISREGVTGHCRRGSRRDLAQAGRQNPGADTRLPVGVGFGISKSGTRPGWWRKMADAVVCGQLRW